MADVSHEGKTTKVVQRMANVSPEKKTRSWEPAGKGVEAHGSGTRLLLSFYQCLTTIEPVQYARCNRNKWLDSTHVPRNL